MLSILGLSGLRCSPQFGLFIGVMYFFCPQGCF